MKIQTTPWQDAQALRGEYHWEGYPTRVIEQLKGYRPTTVPVDKYGGRMDKTEKATGFYHVAKLGSRWWNIDPDGHAYTNIAVAAVTPGLSANESKALIDTFGDEGSWMETTRSLLLGNGFNALGAWSDVTRLRASSLQSQQPLSYTVLLNLGYEYGAKIRKHPHTGYPGAWMAGAIPVFDPEFPAAIDALAASVAKYKDDANLYGYFIDNELPFKRSNLDTYLALPADDPGHKAAKAWMDRHHSELPDDRLRAEFLGYEADIYFRLTTAALRKYDPNHMILGSRFTEPEYLLPELFKAAGRYCDVVSVNFYTHWTPSIDVMTMWESAAKKPFLISEFYTKAMDSGMTNVTGAGWLVHTQTERGNAYQNVTLQLLENKGNVGWQFFRYQDNDPTDISNKGNTSDVDGNKGIVDSRYRPWRGLLGRQESINRNAYSLIDYFDSREN
ncbi:MAG: hypothetical protein P4L10_04275 [Acidobacteriaceae bacterium]|nr:hypothetical protein [Acidobacteriaceae bacterium]